MSKAQKIAIILVLVILPALGMSLTYGRSPVAIAAERAQSLESDTLFFVSGLQPSILTSSSR